MMLPALEDDTAVRAGRILAWIERGDWAELDGELGRCDGSAAGPCCERGELLDAIADRMRGRLRAGRRPAEGPEAEAELWLLRHLARTPEAGKAYAKPI